MDKYDGVKRLFNGVLGVGMLIASVIFSREGFGFKDGELWWIGLVLAAAATGSQFMLTSKFTDLNLGLVLLGLSAYTYSIYTNIIGIESLQEVKNPYLAWGAGIFLDIYPEMAIAWALKASREGDLVGNLMKMFNNYEALLPKNQSATQNPQHPNRDRGTQKPMYNAGAPTMQHLPRSAQKPTHSEPQQEDIPEFLRQGMRKPGKSQNHQRQ